MPPKTRAAAKTAQKSIAKTAKETAAEAKVVEDTKMEVEEKESEVEAQQPTPPTPKKAVTPKKAAAKPAAAAAAAKTPKATKAASVKKEAKKDNGVDTSPMSDKLYWQWDDALNIGMDGEYSDIVKIGGFEWRLWFCKYGGGDHQLFVECLQSRETPVWYADVTVKFRLIDQGYGVDFVETREDTASMGKWLLRSKQMDRYIAKNCGGDEDIVEAEVTITVKERKGDRFRRKPEIDFFSPNDDFFDCELAVKDKKMYVNKHFVASHSQFFNDLFFAKTAKKDQKTFKVENVEPEDLAKLFGYLYWIDLSEGHTITIEDCVTVLNYEKMAALAVQFQVPDLHAAVESFMMDSYEVEPWAHAKKLREAEKYGMNVWKEVVMDGMRGYDWRKVKESGEFKELSADLKNIVNDKIDKSGN